MVGSAFVGVRMLGATIWSTEVCVVAHRHGMLRMLRRGDVAEAWRAAGCLREWGGETDGTSPGNQVVSQSLDAVSCREVHI
jgi:hypothetical protein